MNGIELIAQERQRQVEVEGWTPEHDSTHINGEIALAAACYALPAENTYISDQMGDVHIVDALWPWDPKWFKPSETDRIRDLVKAGALISAEIDRLTIERDHSGKKYNVTHSVFFGGSSLVGEGVGYFEAERLRKEYDLDEYDSVSVVEFNPSRPSDEDSFKPRSIK